MASENKKHRAKMNGDEEIRTNELAKFIEKEKTPRSEQLKDITPSPQNYKKFQGEDRKTLPREVFWGVAGLIILFVAGSIISFFVVKQKIASSIATQSGTLQAGITDLQDFNTQSAQQEFQSISGSATPSLGGVLGVFGGIFKGGSSAIGSFGDLAKQLSALTLESENLQNSLFNFVASGQGAGLLSDLSNIRNTLAAVDADSDQLSGALSSFGAEQPSGASVASGENNFYLPIKTQIEGTENFLDAFIPWLSSSTSHHVLVLFQNPSEMRPGGGFLGSYADVTIAGGNITNISVHDIADVDAAFKEKIIPPAPLQPEGDNFRPADANWFLDFPTSASKTLQFFEASSLYANTSTSAPYFDGAIAITPQVISDLLSLTGPITVSSSKVQFTSDNFLVQIQNIVQQGQAASNPTDGEQDTYPKAVIGQLSQAIFANLAGASSTDAEKQQLLGMALNWIGNRDVMAYFPDPDFENFVTNYGAGGDVYQLPQNFNGDYLAIADADINSDKSELYVAQKVSWDAEINPDGTITDTLAIDRTHNGNQSSNWWYQTANQDYLQVFVPDNSSLTNETGGVVKKITAPINYLRNGYSTDPTVAAIASSTQSIFLYPAVTTHEEDGKEVFATWADVSKGKTTEIDLDYTHRAFVPPADGTQYQFVFEKQAGTSRSYSLEIDAPLGYVFAETGLATYTYTSNDPPGRLIINLTLQTI